MTTDIKKLTELYELGKGIIDDLDASVKSYASDYSKLENELGKEKEAHKNLVLGLEKLIGRK